MNEFVENAEKMYDIIMQQKEQIEKVLKSNRPSYYHGYSRILIDNGFEDVNGCDSFCEFRCKGSGIRWSICSWRKWEIPSTVSIGFGEPHRLRIDTKNNFIEDFVRLKLAKEDFGGFIRKEPKYKKFVVRDSALSIIGSSIIGEFDDIESAKEFAITEAKENCKQGRNSHLKQFYHMIPIDTTKYCRYALFQLEYYKAHGKEQTIYVEGEY